MKTLTTVDDIKLFWGSFEGFCCNIYYHLRFVDAFRYVKHQNKIYFQCHISCVGVLT